MTTQGQGSSVVDPGVLLTDVHRKPYAKYETLNGLRHQQSWTNDTKDVLQFMIGRRNYKDWFGQADLLSGSGPPRIQDMEPTQDTPFKRFGGWIKMDPLRSVFQHRDGPAQDWLTYTPSIPEGDVPVRPKEVMPVQVPLPPQNEENIFNNKLAKGYLGAVTPWGPRSTQQRAGNTELLNEFEDRARLQHDHQ